MPTPDLTGYNDLALFDVQPSDLVNRALLDAAVKLPDWQPRDGNTEVVLLEALSLIAAEVVYAVNRLPGGVVMTLQTLYGITRGVGTAPSADVTFTVSDAFGHLIPAGTVFRLTYGSDVVDFATDVDLPIAAGSSTGTVAATGQSLTAAVNGVAAGTVLQLVTAIPAVDTVELATDVAAGSDPESDADWRDRTIQRFTRLNDTLVQPDHFTTEALTFPQVVRATSINDYDGTATAAGHITTAVLGAAGATLSSGDKASILADLGEKALINLTPHVVDPTITDIDVTTALTVLPGYDPAIVQAAVETALTIYLSTDTWPWAATVRLNKLIQAIEDVPGVDYATVSLPTGDVALTGVAPLAAAGTLTVTT